MREDLKETSCVVWISEQNDVRSMRRLSTTSASCNHVAVFQPSAKNASFALQILLFIWVFAVFSFRDCEDSFSLVSPCLYQKLYRIITAVVCSDQRGWSRRGILAAAANEILDRKSKQWQKCWYTFQVLINLFCLLVLLRSNPLQISSYSPLFSFNFLAVWFYGNNEKEINFPKKTNATLELSLEECFLSVSAQQDKTHSYIFNWQKSCHVFTKKSILWKLSDCIQCGCILSNCCICFFPSFCISFYCSHQLFYKVKKRQF